MQGAPLRGGRRGSLLPRSGVSSGSENTKLREGEVRQGWEGRCRRGRGGDEEHARGLVVGLGSARAGMRGWLLESPSSVMALGLCVEEEVVEGRCIVRCQHSQVEEAKQIHLHHAQSSHPTIISANSSLGYAHVMGRASIATRLRPLLQGGLIKSSHMLQHVTSTTSTLLCPLAISAS